MDTSDTRGALLVATERTCMNRWNDLENHAVKAGVGSVTRGKSFTKMARWDHFVRSHHIKLRVNIRFGTHDGTSPIFTT